MTNEFMRGRKVGRRIESYSCDTYSGILLQVWFIWADNSGIFESEYWDTYSVMIDEAKNLWTTYLYGIIYI
jgi:hypothetical protein